MSESPALFSRPFVTDPMRVLERMLVSGKVPSSLDVDIASDCAESVGSREARNIYDGIKVRYEMRLTKAVEDEGVSRDARDLIDLYLAHACWLYPAFTSDPVTANSLNRSALLGEDLNEMLSRLAYAHFRNSQSLLKKVAEVGTPPFSPFNLQP